MPRCPAQKIWDAINLSKEGSVFLTNSQFTTSADKEKPHMIKNNYPLGVTTPADDFDYPVPPAGLGFGLMSDTQWPAPTSPR